MTTPWWTRGDSGPTTAELRAHVLEVLQEIELRAWCSCGAGEYQPPELHSPPCPGAEPPEGYARMDYLGQLCAKDGCPNVPTPGYLLCADCAAARGNV